MLNIFKEIKTKLLDIFRKEPKIACATTSTLGFIRATNVNSTGIILTASGATVLGATKEATAKNIEYSKRSKLHKAYNFPVIKPSTAKRPTKKHTFVSEVNRPAVYVLFFDDMVVYVGQSIKPYSRINNHTRDKEFHSFRILHCRKERMLHWEKILINHYRPHYNVQGKSKT